ncbi:PhzF family phenazine biosynthesis protein [Crossiella sp. CA198]|uniref:PhzF family phenazine biosynthesis protein n=1 Tax=Crossiella sp. CA198 TaxID=3455607 RepID=UPI003F8D516F
MEIFVVDAFTDTAFGGNPAGVVLLAQPRSAEWMQAVAAEMKHAETAFVDPAAEGAKPLRWFTPTMEVDLCGHATLATAHVLGGEQRFSTRSGELSCTPAEDGSITMDFPADRPVPIEPGPDLLAGLPGVTIQATAQAVSDILVEVATAAEVRALVPDLAAIGRIPNRGVIVTAPGDRPGLDVVSRCFYPAFGVPEDPVTGSAHCTLASWWAPRLGDGPLTAEQASPRGGIVRMTLRDNRVSLSGRAVTVLKGQLLV